jgi:hypothetical protein
VLVHRGERDKRLVVATETIEQQAAQMQRTFGSHCIADAIKRCERSHSVPDALECNASIKARAVVSAHLCRNPGQISDFILAIDAFQHGGEPGIGAAHRRIEDNGADRRLRFGKAIEWLPSAPRS